MKAALARIDREVQVREREREREIKREGGKERKKEREKGHMLLYYRSNTIIATVCDYLVQDAIVSGAPVVVLSHRKVGPTITLTLTLTLTLTIIPTLTLTLTHRKLGLPSP